MKKVIFGRPPVVSFRLKGRDGQVASTATRQVLARAAIRRRYDLVMDMLRREENPYSQP